MLCANLICVVQKNAISSAQAWDFVDLLLMLISLIYINRVVNFLSYWSLRIILHLLESYWHHHSVIFSYFVDWWLQSYILCVAQIMDKINTLYLIYSAYSRLNIYSIVSHLFVSTNREGERSWLRDTKIFLGGQSFMITLLDIIISFKKESNWVALKCL